MPTDEQRAADRNRIRRLRMRSGGRTDNDRVSGALEHRLARWAYENHLSEVVGLERHQKAAWVRRHYPDMVDETRQQVRQALDIPKVSTSRRG
jgi:hypothetical protein